MWGKIIIPMYRLWLNGLYGLYGPRCPLFSKRPINLISLSLSCLGFNVLRKYCSIQGTHRHIPSPCVLTLSDSCCSWVAITVLIARFMGPTWGPGGPHVGPVNFAIWVPAPVNQLDGSYWRYQVTRIWDINHSYATGYKLSAEWT